MSRADRMAAAAAQAASEAGRVLQAAGQAKAAESVEPRVDEVAIPAAPKRDDTRERMMEGLYEGRKKKASEGAKDDAGFPPPGLPPEEAKGQTEEERAEEEAIRKATKAREDAAKQQQKKDEDKAKADAAAQQAPKVDQPELPLEPTATATPTASTTSRQKVDGVEYDVPLSEIEEAGSEKAWRLNKAAENRLAKSNEVVAKAQAQIAAWMQQNAPKAPPPPTQQQLLQKLAANRFGSDEEFATVFQEVLGQAVPKVDQNAIILQTTASIKRDSANSRFSKEFSDILANPLVKKLASQLEMDALSPYVVDGKVNWGELAQLDWDNVYSTIGTQVRGAFGQRQSQPAQTPAASASGTPSQLSEKEARKASIVNLPQAAAARAVPPAEEKPETREEALNRMRKSRGIPTG